MATDYFQARTTLRVANGLMRDAMQQLPPASVAFTRVLDVQMALEALIQNVVPKGNLPPVVLIHGVEYERKDNSAKVGP